MYFTSSEQRDRSRAFDRFVATTAAALAHPKVGERLGSLVAELVEINDTAYLPNENHGELSTPFRHRGTTDVPIVILPPEDYRKAEAIVAPLTTEVIRQYPTPVCAWSDTYRIDTARELSLLWESETPEEEYRESYASVVSLCHPTPDNSRILMGRPVIAVEDSEEMRTDHVLRGSTMAHEELHVLDYLTDGPMYLTRTYEAATELRASHVSYAIHEAYNHTGAGYDQAAWVEILRQEEVDDMSHPFTPTPHIVRLLTEH